VERRVHLFVTHCVNTAKTSPDGLPESYLTMGTTEYPRLSTLAYAEEQCSALAFRDLRDQVKRQLRDALLEGEDDLEMMDVKERAATNLNCALIALIAAPNITEDEFAELTAPARQILGDIELLDREAILAETEKD